MIFKRSLIVFTSLVLSACSGLLQSHLPEPDVYTLTSASVEQAMPVHDPVLVVARPTVRAGLDTDRLAVTREDRRSDVYADARWAAPLPKMVEGLLLDALRSATPARAVISDHGAFRGRYLLQTEITEFTADYSGGGKVPTVRVSLRGELGVPGERRLVAMVAGTGTAVARLDQRHEVVAAYQAAWESAARQLARSVDGAIEGLERP
jgi:cholesterol transport system auxiliary component